jgi:MFS family permease
LHQKNRLVISLLPTDTQTILAVQIWRGPINSHIRPNRILPLIILAQFLGTASWFAGNAVLPSLTNLWGLEVGALAQVTNAVQLGFITGALLFALFSLSDRLRPSHLFFLCALLSALINLVSAYLVENLMQLTLLRFLAGFMLAGIYPVGMKLAATWYPEGLGRALGFLVGSLALGTAAPHLFAAYDQIDWRQVMGLVGALNLFSGLIILLAVGEGPNRLSPAPVRLRQIRGLWNMSKLRASALGYFGHMWELYAIWAIAPIWIAAWANYHQFELSISLGSFSIIAIGALGCALGGIWSQRIGSAVIASRMLTISGICCLLSPLIFETNIWLTTMFWAIWGFAIVADSPQFSTLSALNAPPEAVGTALTLINAVGFTLTLIAIQLSVTLLQWLPVAWIPLILLPGPILGVIAMRPLTRKL